jgi:hypothetical protein
MAAAAAAGGMSPVVDDDTEPEDGLSLQDLRTLNVAELTPLTPAVISRQATINIGTIGHVAHGKSTVVKAISGVQVCLCANVFRASDSPGVAHGFHCDGLDCFESFFGCPHLTLLLFFMSFFFFLLSLSLSLFLFLFLSLSFLVYV